MKDGLPRAWRRLRSKPHPPQAVLLPQGGRLKTEAYGVGVRVGMGSGVSVGMGVGVPTWVGSGVSVGSN